MRYSNEILTDDNFDEELEKLSNLVGIWHNNYDCFVKELDNSFSVQKNEYGFDEWVSSNISSDSSGMIATQSCKLAYEFANGFIVFWG